MSDNQQLIRLRMKKLGILICDARLTSHKSVEECAEILGISPKQYQSYENGTHAPSLTEIEILACFLSISLNHFWGQNSLSKISSDQQPHLSPPLQKIRDRITGTRLHIARTKAELSHKQLASLTSINPNKLKQYEMGEVSIPLPELEAICRELNLTIEDFIDREGLVGKWQRQQQFVQNFLALPKEYQEFVCKPVNHPYIELVMHLSALPVEKLRIIAESLLEITY